MEEIYSFEGIKMDEEWVVLVNAQLIMNSQMNQMQWVDKLHIIAHFLTLLNEK